MSRPAPASARVLAQARFDTGTLLRNGEQLLVSLVLPALALVGVTLAPFPTLSEPRIDTVAPGILALAVLSTAFTGQAISTAFDRRYGVLRLLGSTPLGRGGLLAGRIIAVLVVEVIQFVVLGAVALLMGWRPDLAGILPFLVLWVRSRSSVGAGPEPAAATIEPTLGSTSARCASTNSPPASCRSRCRSPGRCAPRRCWRWPT